MDKLTTTEHVSAQIERTPTKEEMAELVYANTSADGRNGVPIDPCPCCGKETVDHTSDPVTGAPRMICFTADCAIRLAYVAIDTEHAKV